MSSASSTVTVRPYTAATSATSRAQVPGSVSVTRSVGCASGIRLDLPTDAERLWVAVKDRLQLVRRVLNLLPCSVLLSCSEPVGSLYADAEGVTHPFHPPL